MKSKILIALMLMSLLIFRLHIINAQDDQSSTLRISITLTSEVVDYDQVTGLLILEDDLAVQIVDEPQDFVITPGIQVIITGELSDDGTLTITEIALRSEDDRGNDDNSNDNASDDNSNDNSSGDNSNDNSSNDNADDNSNDNSADDSSNDEDNNPLLKVLSEALNIPYEALSALQDEGYSVPNIVFAYVLADAAAADVSDILALLDSDTSWDDILAAYSDVTPDDLVVNDDDDNSSDDNGNDNSSDDNGNDNSSDDNGNDNSSDDNGNDNSSDDNGNDNSSDDNGNDNSSDDNGNDNSSDDNGNDNSSGGGGNDNSSGGGGGDDDDDD